MINQVGNVLLILSALLNLELILLYHRSTRGSWRSSELGRHLMSYMAATALVLTLACARIITMWFGIPDPVWFQVMRVATYATLPAIFLWRRYLIVQSQKGVANGRRR